MRHDLIYTLAPWRRCPLLESDASELEVQRLLDTGLCEAILGADLRVAVDGEDSGGVPCGFHLLWWQGFKLRVNPTGFPCGNVTCCRVFLDSALWRSKSSLAGLTACRSFSSAGRDHGCVTRQVILRLRGASR